MKTQQYPPMTVAMLRPHAHRPGTDKMATLEAPWQCECWENDLCDATTKACSYLATLIYSIRNKNYFEYYGICMVHIWHFSIGINSKVGCSHNPKHEQVCGPLGTAILSAGRNMDIACLPKSPTKIDKGIWYDYLCEYGTIWRNILNKNNLKIKVKKCVVSKIKKHYKNENLPFFRALAKVSKLLFQGTIHSFKLWRLLPRSKSDIFSCIWPPGFLWPSPNLTKHAQGNCSQNWLAMWHFLAMTPEDLRMNEAALGRSKRLTFTNDGNWQRSVDECHETWPLARQKRPRPHCGHAFQSDHCSGSWHEWPATCIAPKRSKNSRAAPTSWTIQLNG